LEYFLNPIYYINTFHFCLLALLIFALFSSFTEKPVYGLNFLVMGLFYILIVLIGFRPVHRVFGDMGNYAEHYESNSYGLKDSSDIFFYYLMNIFKRLDIPTNFYFAFNFVFYLIPMLIFSKIHFRKLWPYAFLMFLCFFEFFSYGTNGIRNGLACSIFILALSFENKKYFRYIYLFSAVLFHFSLILPVTGYLISLYFQKVKYFFVFWFSTLIISLFSGDIFSSLFSRFLPERTNYYLNNVDEVIYKTGFRIDFIIYSFIGVLASYYFIYIKKFEDKFYNKLVMVFLFSNSFWLLVIRANFTNRIAYLSWFILAPVIIYPLLKTKFFKNQFSKICLIILFFFSISFYLNILR
jgi:hypothetical protein